MKYTVTFVKWHKEVLAEQFVQWDNAMAYALRAMCNVCCDFRVHQTAAASDGSTTEMTFDNGHDRIIVVKSCEVEKLKPLPANWKPRPICEVCGSPEGSPHRGACPFLESNQRPVRTGS